MKLRLQGVELQGDRDGFLALTVVSPRRISVLIETPEAHGLDRSGGAVATARMQLEPNDAVARGFAALADLRLPEGTPQSALLDWRRYQDASGRLKPGLVYPQRGLPQAMNSFIEQARTDLTQAIRRSCHALRWRYALLGPDNSLRPLGAGAEWSLDSGTWHPLPAHADMGFETVPDIDPAPSVIAEIQALLDAGQDEPIAHQLFREAWENRLANRRSALVIAVTALEIGINAFLSQINPTAHWLIANLPSPPLRRILSEYIPSLVVPGAIDGKAQAPPKATLDLIDKAVSLRNRVANTSGEEVSRDSLEDMLTAVRDVLWMLDLYSGASWATTHMSTSTLAALGLPSDGSAA